MFENLNASAIKLIISDAVAENLVSYAKEGGWKNVTTVSDSNTYPLIGRTMNHALQHGNIANKNIILEGGRVVADESAVMSVLTGINIDTDAIIGIGSGTITDIVRFVSHRLQKHFVSIPTAPSVDSYTSSGAPLIIKGFKQNILCHQPSLIIASPSILSSAPPKLIAAGFGDMLGKATAVADWELAHILADEPFDKGMASNIRIAVSETRENASGIIKGNTESIMILFRALALTGDSMNRFGSSAPASGSEHHISHFIEMRRLITGEEAIYHGLKVALGTIISAHWYRLLRSLNKETIEKLPVSPPDFESDLVEIKKLLGEPGTIMLERNTFLSTLDATKVSQIRKRLIDNWERIQEIAKTVPDPEELAKIFTAVGAPAKPEHAGITSRELNTALRLGHYVRNRFTVRTLLFTIGIPAEIDFNFQ